MEDIVIMGAGGFAREVAFLIENINRTKPMYNLLGFVDKDNNLKGKHIGRYTIIGDDEWLANQSICAVLGSGHLKVISNIVEKFKDRSNISFPNLVHPATIWDKERIRIGRGNVICAGNIFTTDIKIGSFNIINLNSTYGHDVKIGDCSVFNPGVSISGWVTIGSGCLIGTGARILENLSVGDGAVVGAGAVTTKDTKERTTVVGIPAKPIIKDC